MHTSRLPHYRTSRLNKPTNRLLTVYGKFSVEHYNSRRSSRRGFEMAIDIQGMTPLLQVFDMATSLEFYCGVLGFEIVATDKTAAPNHNWVWLRLNSVDLMLNTAYDCDERPPVPNASRVA